MDVASPKNILSWLIPVAILGGLWIFSATFFAYASAHANHRPGGYAPAIVGVFLFASFSAVLSYLTLSGPKDIVRLLTAIGIAALESVVFGFLLLFLLVNSFGS
jgi:hypothetical protein